MPLSSANEHRNWTAVCGLIDENWWANNKRKWQGKILMDFCLRAGTGCFWTFVKFTWRLNPHEKDTSHAALSISMLTRIIEGNIWFGCISVFTLWTILNETGHGVWRDWKRGWVVHWPQSTSFSTLNSGSSSHRILINYFFSFRPTEQIYEGVFCCFLCYAGNSRNEVVHLAVSVRIKCFSRQLLSQPFCQSAT